MCSPYLRLKACSRYACCSHAAIEHKWQSQRQLWVALKPVHCVAQVVAEELVHFGPQVVVEGLEKWMPACFFPFFFLHDVSADECIINRVSNLLMHGIRKPHSRVFDKTHDETGERETSLSFTFALEGNLPHFPSDGPGNIHFYALEDVVNQRADLDNTI